jgi:threonine dehydrogenase-like Zn-dependent dehydrogenase
MDVHSAFKELTMKALCWHGTGDVRVDEVPDPRIEQPSDVIVQITASGICGSDLHLFNGVMPTMESGDILGHEPMGVVVEKGSSVTNLQVGDRVVVPFTISCGECFFCQRSLFSCCDTSNPNAAMASQVMGHSPAGLFGYSHMLGGFAGGQAEYLRVPYADVGPLKIESDLTDEQVLFLSDIFPTGYMAAENAEIEPGDTVAVWGCGPVGQFAIQSAWMLGAGRVIAIDQVPERLAMAAKYGRAETLNFAEADIYEQLQVLTNGRGPDRCIDAVGCEAHGVGMLEKTADKVGSALNVTGDRTHALSQAIRCCRKGGTVSIPGAYVATTAQIPLGAAMNKALTIKMGQTHMQRYMKPLLGMIEARQIDPTFVITHRIPLEEAPEAYRTFRDQEEGCIKVVIKP